VKAKKTKHAESDNKYTGVEDEDAVSTLYLPKAIIPTESTSPDCFDWIDGEGWLDICFNMNISSHLFSTLPYRPVIERLGHDCSSFPSCNQEFEEIWKKRRRREDRRQKRRKQRTSTEKQNSQITTTVNGQSVSPLVLRRFRKKQGVVCGRKL